MNNIEEVFHTLFPAPQFVVKPSGKKVLVIAPHPDDEVIGCGGVLCKHVQGDDQVAIVYITNGTLIKSHNSYEFEKKVEQRMQEALKALSILNIKDYCCLNLPCRGITVEHKPIQELTSILRAFQADLIYIPHLLDRHPDHFMSNMLLATVLSSLAVQPSLIVGYEIWSPLRPTLLVNITDYFPTKLAALKAYASQIAEYDYPKLIDVLGQYRLTLHHPTPQLFRIAVEERRIRSRLKLPYQIPWTHLETFCVLPVKQYIKKVSRLNINNFEDNETCV